MNPDVPPGSQPRRAPNRGAGRDIVRSLADLLADGVPVSDDDGAIRSNDMVEFRVHPSRWPDDEDVVCDLEVTCHARGHWLVDWEGVPVFVQPTPGGGGFWIAWLDAHGEARFHDLPLGEYRVTLGLESGVYAGELPRLKDDYRNLELPHTEIGLSIVKQPRGLTYWAESSREDLRGCRVLCCRRDAQTGRLEARGMIRLAAAAQAPERFVGRVDEEVGFAAAGQEETIFIVLPPERPPDRT